MVASFIPLPPFRTSSASDYAFAMTAGTFIYATGYVSGGGIGAIDGEPLNGFPLLYFVSTAGAASIYFDGDATALLGSRTVWVAGVSYAAGFSGWSYDGDDGATVGTWASDGPIFVDADIYAVEIK